MLCSPGAPQRSLSSDRCIRPLRFRNQESGTSSLLIIPMRWLFSLLTIITACSFPKIPHMNEEVKNAPLKKACKVKETHQDTNFVRRTWANLAFSQRSTCLLRNLPFTYIYIYQGDPSSRPQGSVQKTCLLNILFAESSI